MSDSPVKIWKQSSDEAIPTWVEIDPSLVPLPLQIAHGRSGTAVQPDAPVCEFEYWSDSPPCAAGDQIKVEQTNPGRWSDNRILWADPGWSWTGRPASIPPSIRFIGEVDSVTAVESEGEVVSWRVRAIGKQADLGRIGLRMERPSETDVERVLAIAAKAGIVVNIAGTDSLMLARDELDRDCLDAIHQVCGSTGGLFWQARDGSYWYGTSNHRERPTDWVLPAGAILDGLEWEKSTEQILNHLTIRYPRPELSPPPVTGKWTWSTNLNTGADPGAGNMRGNDVNATQVSTIALSATDASGTDITLSVTRRLAEDRLYLQQESDPTRWAKYTLTGPPVDNGDWFTVPVDFKEHGEVGEPVAGGQSVLLSFDSRLEGGEVQETFSDEASMDQWGERHVEFSTLCNDADQAGLLALTILARRAQPYWVMPGVLVPYRELSSVEADVMQSLDVSVGILAPVPSTPGPTPSAVAQWAVEGYVEEWREDGYWVQLSLSDWARSSSSSTRTWAILRDTMTWTQAAAKTYRELLVEVA